MQTDASDEYWAAALFEEIDGKKNICGYKSGAFKPSELHYHSTFKEILAVKNGIEKFQFHLLELNFLVKMDMSSFPKMLQFKRKMLPHLRFSDPDRSLNRKRERFKVFEVEPRSNRGRIVMTS